MRLRIEGFAPYYELDALARMLFHAVTRDQPDTPAATDGDRILITVSPERAAVVSLWVAEKQYTESLTLSPTAPEKALVAPLAQALYRLALESGRPPLRWGILTGIRPVKLFHQAAAAGLSPAETARQMQEKYLLSPEMVSLAQQIQTTEAAINAQSKPNGFSLYLSIPFCPQRCSYCSFVSQTVAQMRPLIPQYVDTLCREIRELGEIAASLGLELQTVYFGGGTPTTLSAGQLTQLFETVAASFDLSHLLEYTVEAGRPDTIDREKLLAIKAAGATRLSINPQSMNDSVLAAVGRKHDAAAIVEAFRLARELGFSCINMDLIAGLPTETVESFAASLERVLALSPENITVHTLTLKRSSTLAGAEDAIEHYARQQTVAAMVDHARERIMAAGFAPYYLYRQKNAIGSLDNTGYAKPGSEGLYNVFIMDETHTILAAGAGAVTKLRDPAADRIERIYNYKYPKEYLEGFAALRERKERVTAFYEATRTR